MLSETNKKCYFKQPARRVRKCKVNFSKFSLFFLNQVIFSARYAESILLCLQNASPALRYLKFYVTDGTQLRTKVGKPLKRKI